MRNVDGQTDRQTDGRFTMIMLDELKKAFEAFKNERYQTG